MRKLTILIIFILQTDHVHVKENELIEDREEIDLDLGSIEKEVGKGIVIEIVTEKEIKKGNNDFFKTKGISKFTPLRFKI